MTEEELKKKALWEANLIESALSALLRGMGLHGLPATPALVDHVTVEIKRMLTNLRREYDISEKWGYRVTVNRNTLNVDFQPPVEFLPINWGV